jgi:surface protein
MERMFQSCTSFNSDIGNWDVSNVTNMFILFQDCTSFDQDLSSWQISQVTNLQQFMTNCTLSTANYDALLIGWDAQGAMSYSGTVDFGNSQYTLGGAAEAARTSLISKWGGITDGGGI